MEKVLIWRENNIVNVKGREINVIFMIKDDSFLL